jgi:hypothetical protein
VGRLGGPSGPPWRGPCPFVLKRGAFGLLRVLSGDSPVCLRGPLGLSPTILVWFIRFELGLGISCTYAAYIFHLCNISFSAYLYHRLHRFVMLAIPFKFLIWRAHFANNGSEHLYVATSLDSHLSFSHPHTARHFISPFLPHPIQNQAPMDLVGNHSASRWFVWVDAATTPAPRPSPP